MIKSVEEYLELLKAELRGSDAATIQDALADAEEHLIDKSYKQRTNGRIAILLQE